MSEISRVMTIKGIARGEERPECPGFQALARLGHIWALEVFCLATPNERQWLWVGHILSNTPQSPPLPGLMSNPPHIFASHVVR